MLLALSVSSKWINALVKVVCLSLGSIETLEESTHRWSYLILGSFQFIFQLRVLFDFHFQPFSHLDEKKESLDVQHHCRTFSSSALWCSKSDLSALRTSTSEETPWACRRITVVRMDLSWRATNCSKMFEKQLDMLGISRMPSHEQSENILECCYVLLWVRWLHLLSRWVVHVIELVHEPR